MDDNTKVNGGDSALEVKRQVARSHGIDFTRPAAQEQLTKRTAARFAMERGASLPGWYISFAKFAGGLTGALAFFQDILLERIIPVVALFPLFLAEIARVHDGISLFDEARAWLLAMAMVAAYFALLSAWAGGRRGNWLTGTTIFVGGLIVLAGTAGSVGDLLNVQVQQVTAAWLQQQTVEWYMSIVLAALTTAALLVASHWVVSKLHVMNAAVREQVADFFGREFDADAIRAEVEIEYLSYLIERRRAKLSESATPPATSLSVPSVTSSPNSEEDTEEVVAVQ